MIDKEYGVFLVSCDSGESDTCQGDREFDVDDDWDTLMKEMKSEGWETRKVNDEWENYCPECAKKRKKDIESFL